MSVKHNKDDGKLILEIDNGDLTKLDQVMDKWSFKDYQSLLRFAVSVLLLSEDKTLSIKYEGKQQEIKPAADLVNNS